MLNPATLACDIELAKFRIDHCQSGWHHDVPSQRSFVDFRPERMAVLPLHSGVGNIGVRQVGQGIDRNQIGRRLNDVRFEEQIGQGRREKDDPRQPVEEVQHGV